MIAPEPYLTSVVLAGGLVSACGTPEQRQELLGALSAGESVLAFAHDEPGRGWTASAEQVTAAKDDDGWTLTGVKEPVPHGARADVLLVSAALPDGGTGLFVVSGDDAERTGYPTYDGTRAARVAFGGTAAIPLGEPGNDLANSISTVQDITRVSLLDNIWALVVLYTSMNLPIAIWMMRSFFLEVPGELLEAASLDGASLWRSVREVILPLVSPGIAATALICVIFAWNEFFLAVNLTAVNAQTMPVYLVGFIAGEGQYWAVLSAAATMSALPVILCGWFAQNKLVRGLSFGAIK